MKKMLLILILGISSGFPQLANAVSVEYLLGQTDSTASAATTAYVASLVVKTTGGRLYQLTGYNSKTATQFIHIYDLAALPADTATPKLILIVPASSNFSFDLPIAGRLFLNGIVVGNSSTGPTKTIGAADVWFNAEYK